MNDALVDQIPSGWKFTLPSEAQWQYAARGGKYSKNYTYSGTNDRAQLWTSNSSYIATQPVATKPANELGLYDMSGNVWERCRDKSSNFTEGQRLVKDYVNTAGSSWPGHGGSVYDYDNDKFLTWAFRYQWGFDGNSEGNFGIRLALIRN